MNKQLVLMLRVHYYLIYLISLKLFLSYLEKVICVEVALPYVDIPHVDVTSRVADKKSTV